MGRKQNYTYQRIGTDNEKKDPKKKILLRIIIILAQILRSTAAVFFFFKLMLICQDASWLAQPDVYFDRTESLASNEEGRTKNPNAVCTSSPF